MLIGILTRHCYPNYGSLLQAYALQSEVAKMGAEVEVIDYVPRGERPRVLVFENLRESRLNVGLLKRLAYVLVQWPNYYVMARRFRRFQLELLRLSPAASGFDDHPDSVNQRYAAVLVGSDQVWNRIHGRLDGVYFVANPNADCMRLSYAASFGASKPQLEDRDFIESALHEFQSISVREESGAEYLRKADLPARVDVDPVLLMDPDEWRAFALTDSAARPPYLLVYQLHNTPEFNSIVATLANRTGLPVRRVGVDARQIAREGMQYLIHPRKFVGLISAAAFLVTDSFHGTAFGTLFGVPFASVLPNVGRARLSDFLATYGLQTRLVTSVAEAEALCLVLDFHHAHARLAQLREMSKNYVSQLVEMSRRACE